MSRSLVATKSASTKCQFLNPRTDGQLFWQCNPPRPFSVPRIANLSYCACICSVAKPGCSLVRGYSSFKMLSVKRGYRLCYNLCCWFLLEKSDCGRQGYPQCLIFLTLPSHFLCCPHKRASALSHVTNVGAGGGSIVFCSSAVARHGIPNHEAIAAAKAGIQGELARWVEGK
jgi:hypothetical protein